MFFIPKHTKKNVGGFHEALWRALLRHRRLGWLSWVQSTRELHGRKPLFTREFSWRENKKTIILCELRQDWANDDPIVILRGNDVNEVADAALGFWVSWVGEEPNEARAR